MSVSHEVPASANIPWCGLTGIVPLSRSRFTLSLIRHEKGYCFPFDLWETEIMHGHSWPLTLTVCACSLEPLEILSSSSFPSAGTCYGRSALPTMHCPGCWNVRGPVQHRMVGVRMGEGIYCPSPSPFRRTLAPKHHLMIVLAVFGQRPFFCILFHSLIH